LLFTCVGSFHTLTIDSKLFWIQKYWFLFAKNGGSGFKVDKFGSNSLFVTSKNIQTKIRLYITFKIIETSNILSQILDEHRAYITRKRIAIFHCNRITFWSELRMITFCRWLAIGYCSLLYVFFYVILSALMAFVILLI